MNTKQMVLTATFALGAFFAEAKVDKLGLTPLYWIDLNGVETQQGSATLKGDNFDGFGPLRYEPIPYWGRKGCYSFNDARGQNFACGTGSFTLFAVARGGNSYTSTDAIVFALGRPFGQSTNPSLELVIKNRITEKSAAAYNYNEVAVRTWKGDAATRDVIRTAVHGYYPAWRYVPFAITYDATKKTLTLYANGVEIGSATDDFTGFTEATCWWQVASVRGGAIATAGDSYTGARDYCGVTDFRYYTHALSASDVSTISADFPLTDQTGERPYYHYAFNGNTTTKAGTYTNLCQILGQDRVRNNLNWKGTPAYYSEDGHNYFYAYSCGRVRGDVCAARSMPSCADCRGDFWPLTNSFTLAMSAMINPTGDVKNVILFSLGTTLDLQDSVGKNAGLVLLLRERGKVGLDWWGNDKVMQTGVTANLSCTDVNHVHDYAIVHDRSAGTASLFVDGVCYGTIEDFPGFVNSDPDSTEYRRTFGSWAFSAIHGGTPSSYDASAQHTVEEFRFYTKALTAAQLCTLSDAVPAWREGTDPTGRPAHMHYSFDGSVSVDGHNLLTAEGKIRSVGVSSYRDIRDGTCQAGVIKTTENHGGYFPTNRPFTIFMSADPGYFTDNACLFSVGCRQSSLKSGVALVKRTPTSLAVGNWKASATADPISTIVSEGAAGAFRAYALNVDPEANTVQFFVDGVATGNPVTLPYPLADNHWQFSSIYGGTPSGFVTNPELCLEDFRVYVPALGAAEIAKLAAAYPADVKTDANGARPDYWYAFEPTETPPLGAKVLRDGSSGSYRKMIGGDSPVRDGSYACTNVNITGRSYGNAGGLELGSTFSIFLSARVKRATSEKKSGVLLGFGSQDANDTETLAIACESTDTVSCYSFYGQTRKTLLVQSAVPGMQEDFNAYCVTWNGTTLALYLNGTLVASEETGSDFAGFTSGPRWQIGSIYGNAREFFENAVFTLEDFRIYGKALSADEVAAVSAELPRWPRGALWQGGDAGTLSDSVWQIWSWSAAKCGAWTYNQPLTSGLNVAFDASDTPLALVGTSQPTLGEVSVSRAIELSGRPFSCTALTVLDEGSLKPADVTGLLSPGRKMATVSGTVTGIDFTAADDYGNKTYRTNGKLYYGDGTLPGISIIVR